MLGTIYYYGKLKRMIVCPRLGGVMISHPTNICKDFPNFKGSCKVWVNPTIRANPAFLINTLTYKKLPPLENVKHARKKSKDNEI